MMQRMKPLKSGFLILSFAHALAATAYDPYDCLNDVSNADKEIPVGFATELCSGAWTPEPYKCYIGISAIDEDAYRGLAIELCAGSADAVKTLECYAKSGERGLNRALAITLCGVNKTNE